MRYEKITVLLYLCTKKINQINLYLLDYGCIKNKFILYLFNILI